MATFSSGWLTKIMGVLFRTSGDADIGRTDVVKIGSGLSAYWNPTTKELTLSRDQLDITGEQIITGEATFEEKTEGALAVDAGADSSAVVVASYSCAAGYRYTFKCKVVGEDASGVPVFDAEWEIQDMYSLSAGSLAEASDPVTPEGNPAKTDVAASYAIVSNSLQIKKHNTSGDALTFSAEIVVAAAELRAL